MNFSRFSIQKKKKKRCFYLCVTVTINSSLLFIFKLVREIALAFVLSLPSSLYHQILWKCHRSIFNNRHANEHISLSPVFNVITCLLLLASRRGFKPFLIIIFHRLLYLLSFEIWITVHFMIVRTMFLF
jgi:hypothetical protein